MTLVFWVSWSHDDLSSRTSIIELQLTRMIEIPPSDVEKLGSMLDKLLYDESTTKAVPFQTIIQCRLDKLLEDLHGGETKYEEFQLNEILEKAATLQIKWQMRFGTRYQDIDKGRLFHFQNNGPLRYVSLDIGLDGQKWKVDEIQCTSIPFLDIGMYLSSCVCNPPRKWY
jgi:hypothetical protein